jgi:uncharacterized protein (DUF433 family)
MVAGIWRARITTDRAVLAGKPVVRGTRIAVDHVQGLVAVGWTVEQILASFPGLTVEDIEACVSAGRRDG